MVGQNEEDKSKGSNIPASLVKQLREITGAGMMDCKRALVETNGNIEEATEHLRKAGIAKAEKKLDRESKDGRIEALLSEDGKHGVMLELAAETDFVAKNEEFVNLAKNLGKMAMQNGIFSVEDLLQATIDSTTVADMIKALISKTGENIKLKKLAHFQAGEDEIIYQYVHLQNRVGVMIQLSTTKEVVGHASLLNLAKEIALQIAFSKPIAICREEIPPELLEKEREIFTEQARLEGKPEAQIHRIVDGKMKKYFQENCLLEQEYIRDASIKVADLVSNVSSDLGTDIFIKRIARFEVGTI